MVTRKNFQYLAALVPLALGLSGCKTQQHSDPRTLPELVRVMSVGTAGQGGSDYTGVVTARVQSDLVAVPGGKHIRHPHGFEPAPEIERGLRADIDIEKGKLEIRGGQGGIGIRQGRDRLDAESPQIEEHCLRLQGDQEMVLDKQYALTNQGTIEGPRHRLEALETGEPVTVEFWRLGGHNAPKVPIPRELLTRPVSPQR